MVMPSTAPVIKKYTLAEFWALPEPADHSKLELINGVLHMSPPPEWSHSRRASGLVRRIIAMLIAAADQGQLFFPRAAIWTSRHTYLEPDLFYVSAELLARLDPKRPETADLVIEIVSPGTAIYDYNTKADAYGNLGVRELWLVDEGNGTVEVRYQIGKGFGEKAVFRGGEAVRSRVWPDIELTPDQVFSD